MTYGLINLPFVIVGLIMLAVASRGAGRPSARAIALTGAIVLVMTAVFDNVMIAVGLVGYDPARISGLRIGLAPVEDFAYAVVAVVLLPALWTLLPAGRRRDDA
jgi:lycopene cyclase domain-containing protein